MKRRLNIYLERKMIGILKRDEKWLEIYQGRKIIEKKFVKKGHVIILKYETIRNRERVRIDHQGGLMGDQEIISQAQYESNL